MVLYARNDIQSHHSGRTGHNHRRPAKGDGTPVPIWGINCPPCEQELAGHPAWAATRYKIPLTPDEEAEAADARAAAESAMHQQQLLLAQSAVMSQMAAKNAVPEIDSEDIAVTSDSEPAPSGDGGSPSPPSQESDYDVLTKTDLKDLARDRGLPVSGTREDLVARLIEYDSKNED